MERGSSLESINVKEIVEKIKHCAQEAANEEEFRICFARILHPIFETWGLKPLYERRTIFSGVRKDALYGTVIVEFKAPGLLKDLRKFEKAKEQVKGYIKSEAKDQKYYGRYFGVVIDGFYIGFVRFRRGKWEESEEPLKVSVDTIRKLLEAIRGLKNKPLETQFLLEDFGPKSKITKKVIFTLYNALVTSKSDRTQMLFNDWRRVFSQVCAYSKEKLKGLIKYYGLNALKNVDVEKLMFVIHTYYTLLMKLLTSEIVTLFADSIIGSYLRRLDDAYLRDKERSKKTMWEELRELEEGGIFAELGIKNFLEADYFAWYLDEWDDKIAKVIYEMVKKLLEYEPATIELNPENVKDLFKRLYQHLVPRDIRHKLGEYFTPDWLAELVLEEVGYEGDPDKKILDPACGSGTFLVLAIKKIKEYAEKHSIDKRTLLLKIVKNVQGIDLNPLAVLAAKANYLIALADLLRYRPREGIVIPVYLADSIGVERKTILHPKSEKGSIEVVSLKTAVGEFRVPYEVLERGVLLEILNDINFCIRGKYSSNDFKEYVRERYELSQECLEALKDLYEAIYSLEKENKDKIWTRILMNSFAPLLIGEFDYVVGNPPWIRWEELPDLYRKETKILWEKYGLTKILGRGGFKKDIAMLFVARCLDRFTKQNGRLAFLIPFTVYKTQAGAGFREFLVNGYYKGEEKYSCKVLKIHDLEELLPFEGAVNRTSLIVLEKNKKTKFPIRCIYWKSGKKSINQELTLEEVKKTTKRFDLVLLPFKKNTPKTPWIEITESAYKGIIKILGSTSYEAHEGINTALNQVYWVKVLAKQQKGILIENPPLSGQKRKVKQVKKIIEEELVYPLIRGKDIKKWYVAECQTLKVIIPHDSRTGEPLPESIMKKKYPNTYSYLLEFKEDLKRRAIKPFLKGKPKEPFYRLDNIGEYTFSKYKVVWKEVSARQQKLGFEVAVIGSKGSKAKAIIPDHTVVMVSCDNPKEAYYLSAILNSDIFSLSCLYMVIKGLKRFNIPKFNPKDPLHQKLSNLSQKAHEIARRIYEENREDLKDDLRKIEEEIDRTVAKLYGITDDELKEIKKCLMILKEGEIPEEEEEEAEEDQMNLPKDPIEIEVTPLLLEKNKQQELMISVNNNTEKPIRDVKLEIKLESKLILTETIESVKENSSVTLRLNLPELKEGEYVLEISLYGQGFKLYEAKKVFVRGERKVRRTKSLFDEEIEKLLEE